MNTAMRGAGLALTTMIAAGSLTAFAMPAQAKDHGGGDDRVEARGACTGGGHWKLKAKHDDGRIEYEFEVDTNKVGQRWTVKVSDNGHRIFSGHRTTKAPSGSFSLEKTTKNRAGTDVIKAKATRGSKVCSGKVSL